MFVTRKVFIYLYPVQCMFIGHRLRYSPYRVRRGDKNIHRNKIYVPELSKCKLNTINQLRALFLL